jgi:tetratricopeptide (TPR) repeat protein
MTPPPAQRPGTRAEADDATRLGGHFDDESSNVDLTRLPPGHTPPTDETRLQLYDDPDATRLVGPGSEDPRIPTAIRTDADDHGPLAVGQTFGSRYHIIRLLGVGGMGAVYQAWDAELAVTVALKVIRPEVMADPKSAAEIERRFKRELLLARQVTHRNVVRIHDLGDIGGIKYITMSYVDGSDLATVLKQAGRLPPERALRIARSVVAGLVEAHKADIVHRDLKPANIMIDAEDEALIMDFGIARSTGRPISDRLPGNTTIINNLRLAVDARAEGTVLGAVIGTVEYMAPEQARGQHVDQRADIYALGLIMYDMLAGQQRARRAQSAVAELQARMEKAPPPVRSLAPEVPAPLEQVIARCLEPDPAKRFQTSKEVADALSWLNDKGERIRVRKVVGLRLFAAAIVLGLALLAATWWFARGPAVPVQRDPVSVLIADFQNQSQDASFDGTLEPIVKLALEGAGFINAYDRAGMRRSLDVRPPEVLDERAAQQIAVNQGVGVVLAGSIGRQGNGYAVSMKATQAVTGNVIASVSNRAAGKDQVLSVATKLATSIRKALGDNTSDESQRFAMDKLSATSVEAVHHYAAGMIANSNSRFEDARQSFLKSIEADPDFGMGYTAVAMMSFNLDKPEDTVKYAKLAFERLDSMTERERYRTRGLFHLATNNYAECIKEYGDLVEKYAADISARNNLALCSSRQRKNAEAAKEMREVVKIMPGRALYRENLALYSNYAGEFQAAESEARALKEPGVFGLIALAFAQLGQTQIPQALETYRQMGKIDEQGASYMASGEADIAMYEGRFSDAARILEAAAARDVAARDADRAATKFAILAQVRLLQRDTRRALAAAQLAEANSRIVKIRFLAGRIFVEAGDPAKARAITDSLAKEEPAEPRAYAKILEGAALLKKGDPRAAIKPLGEVDKLLDTWIGHYELGRAYLAAGLFLQADSEFDKCIQRRGEALSLFLDEEPTYGYLPAAYYYQGRVRQELKTARFAESYRTYLAIRGNSKEDPLVPEVRKRAGS